ncbi:hypothetical protein [Streptomyces sp. Caat 7-52]|uniref:hypothetical protein n=1 Tax=Streptomyces sp. Caat 7-52 TaxID=2949637 RepID=UPI0020360CC9|nr:hypothetical protein [Streptomyces sp. Caat 7-52]
MNQSKAILIGAIITGVAAIIAAIITFGGGPSETNACKNEAQTVQNCGRDNEIHIDSPAQSSPASEGPGAAGR